MKGNIFDKIRKASNKYIEYMIACDDVALYSCFNATATEQWQDNVVYETNLHKNARYSKGCLDVILFSC